MKEKAAFIKDSSKKFLLRTFLPWNTKISQEAEKKTFKTFKEKTRKLWKRIIKTAQKVFKTTNIFYYQAAWRSKHKRQFFASRDLIQFLNRRTF